MRAFDKGVVGETLRAIAEATKKGEMPDYVPFEEFRERMKDAAPDDAPVDEEHAQAVASAVDAMLVG